MRRWLTSTAVPRTVATIAQVRPASGWTVVASTVTSAGPRMNTVSSTTASKAKAVCRPALSGTRCDQRARTHEPICGIAAPDSAAHRCGQGARTSSSTVVISPVMPTAKTATATGSTRRCPSRSISRAWSTENSALAMRYDAETVPASE